MPDTSTFGRYAEIPYDQMTPEQQEGYRSLIETRGALGGPNKIWVHNPKLAKVMGPLGAHFRTGYSLSEHEREIAVCIINSKWHSIFPTNGHERAGKAAGLPADKVEAIFSGLPTSRSRPDCNFLLWPSPVGLICIIGEYRRTANGGRFRDQGETSR
jgi:4-carboxymuconolactone decarboxylase